VRDAQSAVRAGHDLAERWASTRPDIVLALGWEAGLAAQVAVRSVPAPVVLRLTRAARSPGSDRDRLENALARGTKVVLVPSAGEVDHLVDRGVRRTHLRVLPDAVDRSVFSDAGAEVTTEGPMRVGVAPAADPQETEQAVALLRAVAGYDAVPLPGASTTDEDLARTLRSLHALVVSDDSEAAVALTLQAMSCAVPVVAVAVGTLSDLVADDVTGILVPRANGITDALRSLLPDSMRRQSMGLAAVDRVKARFDTAVVGAALDALLLEAVGGRVTTSS
jgi:glycosyltransferase involved in cell wall biosynthesis